MPSSLVRRMNIAAEYNPESGITGFQPVPSPQRGLETRDTKMLRLTRSQVRELDRIAIERYLIPGIVLMENAARAVADAACEMLGGDCLGEILLLCGGGNNGGDGLVVARHLHNCGADVSIMLTIDPAKY